VADLQIKARGRLGGSLGLIFLFVFGAAFSLLGAYAGLTEAAEALAEEDDRKLWVSLLGGAAFVAFGVGAMALAILGHRRAGNVENVMALHPDEPWLLQKAWAERRVPSRTGASAVVLALFGTVWTGISTPLVFQVPEEAARQGTPLVWLALLFPVVGVAILAAAFRAFLRWRKFGSSVLELKTLPGVVGGRFEAVLQLSTAIDAHGGMALALECVHKRTTGSGKSRSTHERILWKREQAVARDRFGMGPGGTAIPVEFAVPWGCEPTRGTGSEDEIVWRVMATADVAGVDFYARFDVPVFVTGESSEDVNDDGEIPNVVVSSLAGGDALPGSKIRVRPWRGSGREFWFGPARNPVAATVTTLVAIGIGVVTSYLPDTDAPWALVAGFGFVGALTALGAVVHWIGATCVRVEAGAIHVARGPFGLGRTRTWRTEELSRIAVRRGSQYGNNLYWDIKLEIDRSGRTRKDGTPWPTAHAAGSRLPSESEARAFARAMSATLGLEPTG
jgi:hypothetical protein